MRFIAWGFIIGLLVAGACTAAHAQKKPIIKLQNLTLTVRSAADTADWYASLLGGKTRRGTPAAGAEAEVTRAVHYGDFTLMLRESEDVPGAEELPERHMIHGLFKLGFAVPDLGQVRDRAREMGLTLLVDNGALPASPITGWPKRFSLALDPNGYFVQFFEVSDRQGLVPMMVGISASDFDQAVAFYERDMKFSLRDAAGDASNRRGILERGGFYIELGRFEGSRPPLHEGESGARQISLGLPAGTCDGTDSFADTRWHAWTLRCGQ